MSIVWAVSGDLIITRSQSDSRMKWFILSSTLLALSLCLSAASVDSDSDSWEEFKLKHGKSYDTPEVEEYRKQIFVENKRKIEQHNVQYEQGQRSYKLGVNAFADLTLKEIPNKGVNTQSLDGAWTMIGRSGPTPVQFEATGAELPLHVDWRDKGVVSPVKTQFNCLACYTFAAGDAIESQYAIQYGKHVLLSQQQIVDCSAAEGNLGCQGGMVDWAYQYIIRAGGLELESDYPYEVENGQCQFNSSKIVARITNYGEVKNASEISLQEAVAFYGPISVSIDSSSWEWNYYTEGVFDYAYCAGPADVDHAVLVVGYGTQNGTDYWLVKNSYGEGYGDHGYIKMARNKNNQCNIASYANFPILGDWKPFSPSKKSV